jgi:hypothetical protein
MQPQLDHTLKDIQLLHLELFHMLKDMQQTHLVGLVMLKALNQLLVELHHMLKADILEKHQIELLIILAEKLMVTALTLKVYLQLQIILENMPKV